MKINFDYVSGETRERFEKWFPGSSFCSKELSIRNLPGAIVVPGTTHDGGIYHNGTFLKEAMPDPGWWFEKYYQKPGNVKHVKGRAVFLGVFERCWGHAMTDNLKFLWPLVYEGEKWQDARLVYVTTNPGRDPSENFKELVRCLGIPWERIELVTEPTEFDELYLPDGSFFCPKAPGRRYYTKEYVGCLDRIIYAVMDGQSIAPTRKVYFSRTGWTKGSPDYGEIFIERALRKKGYEIVRPEILGFRDLVRLMQGCSEFVATEGSCSHNSAFMHNGMKVTVIRKSDYIVEHQIPINEAKNFDFTFIDAHWTKLHKDPNYEFAGPFFFYANKRFAAWAGVKPQIFPVMTWMKYFLGWCKIKFDIYSYRGWHKFLRITGIE